MTDCSECTMNVCNVLFGFTDETLKENHAIIDLRFVIPITKRQDAYDFIESIKEKTK